MASTINADNGVVSGSAGLKSSADSSGVLALQTNGTTALSISTGQVVTLTNALPVASGGTNATATPTAGAVAYGTGTAYAFTSAGTSGQALTSNGSSAPTFGTLGVAGGGTGLATTTAYGVIVAGTTSTGAFQQVSGTGTSGQLLTSNGAGALPSWQAAPSGMVYPGAGIAVSTGSAWGTSLTAPSGTIVGTTDTQTLTNKRVTPRVSTTTSSATPTINTDNVDVFGLTALAVNVTSFTTNLSGTPTDGQRLMIYIVGTAARTLTWGASFEASTTALPTTTVTTNRLDVGFVWNAATSKWRCVAVS